MQLVARSIATLERIAEIYRKRDAQAAERVHREVIEQLREVLDSLVRE